MSTKKLAEPNSVQPVQMLLVVAIVIAVVIVTWIVGAPLGSVEETLANPGMYIDLTALAFLIFMYWSSTRIRLAHFALHWVRYGFLLWIAGATFDLMDEIVFQPRWMGYYCEDLLRLSGMFLTGIGIYRIIERINVLYVDARSKSLRDELTQLPNRRFFIDSIKSREHAQVALMILDIDFFKKINDTYGHLVGDEVLFALGKQLSALSSDAILPARIGGEEFAIVIEGLAVDEVQQLAQSVLENVRTILVNNEYSLSISIGAGLRHPGEAQDVFIKKVDEALYRAKNNGRGRIEWAQ